MSDSCSDTMTMDTIVGNRSKFRYSPDLAVNGCHEEELVVAKSSRWCSVGGRGEAAEKGVFR